MSKFNSVFVSPQLFCYVVLGVCVLSFSCTSQNQNYQSDEDSQSVKIMNWNLQTFFDACFDGNEYSEYKSAKSGWCEDKYEARLERLASVIKTLDADVVVMEELEKESQLQDIINRLSGTFDFSSLYKYGAFAKDDGSSIGCALISRIPIESVSVHSLDIRSEQTAQPSMRPILQVRLKKGEKTLVLFINHWKSKSGGAESSEIWRKWQERVLSRLFDKCGTKKTACIACGDFNKDILEFECTSSESASGNVVFYGKAAVRVYSPWLTENLNVKDGGSYWYKESWERIDHFFANENAKIESFCAESGGEWADSENHPLRYKLWTGEGYSDHLPITCTVVF